MHCGDNMSNQWELTESHRSGVYTTPVRLGLGGCGVVSRHAE